MACIISVLLSAIVSCSSGDSRPPSVEPTETVASFHFKQIWSIESNESTTTEHVLEGYYQAPDSARIVSDTGSPFFEAIVIGSQAWKRDRSGWSSANADTIKTLLFANIKVILELPHQKGLEYVDAGPIIAGEATSRFRLTKSSPDSISSELEACRSLLESVGGFLNDTYEAVDLTIGKTTMRMYSMEYTRSRPGATKHLRISVDQYNSPITLTPASVDEPGASPYSSSSENPCAT